MDIRIRVDLFEHPKFRKLCAVCGEAGGLSLIRLWAWAAVYRHRGNLSHMSDEDIARVAGWPVDRAEEFCAALRDDNKGITPWLDADSTLHDWRLEQGYVYYQDKRRETGRESAEKRWSGRHHIPTTAPAKLERKRAGPPRQEASTPAPAPTAEPKYSPAFLEFWSIYPGRRKTNKAGSWRAWQKYTVPNVTLPLIKAALAWQVKTPDWTKDNGEYIPGPEPYLNQHRWEDEPPEQEEEATTRGNHTPSEAECRGYVDSDGRPT